MVARQTVEQFVERSRKVHGDKYSYEKVIYLNNYTHVLIVCPIHGDFSQTPNHHIRGSGCKSCSEKVVGRKAITKEKFVESAEKVHGKAYDYSLVKYRRRDAKVEIICPIHGIFMQRPFSHLSGSGCGACGGILNGENRTKTLEYFLEKARAVHGARYDYSKTVYINTDTKSIIVCPIHGEFLQTPNKHSLGANCPDCCRYGYDRKLPSSLYVLTSDSYTKIGITNRAARIRAKDISRKCGERFAVALELRFDEGVTAEGVETALLRELRQKYQNPKDKFDGYTECFIDVDLVELINRITEVVRTTEQINNQQ